MWPVCPNRKTYCGRERGTSDILVKKRKLFDQSSVLTADRGVIDQSFCNMAEKSKKKKPRCSNKLGCDGNNLLQFLYVSTFKKMYVSLVQKNMFNLDLTVLFFFFEANGVSASASPKVYKSSFSPKGSHGTRKSSN